MDAIIEPRIYKAVGDVELAVHSLTDELVNGRILFLDTPVTSAVTSCLVKTLLVLEQQDAYAPVTLVVSSPGGSVADGLALIDVMQSVSCPVNTVGMGLVASMAAVILACGDHRSAYANTQVMIHQLMGGAGMQQQTDIDIAAERMRELRSRLDGLLASKAHLSAQEFHVLTERDCWCSAERALELGLIDEIVPRKS